MSDTTSASRPVRVRFVPSPTGTPHVGLARTAVFNWAYARHTGGTLVFRIEDTDAARDSEESMAQIIDMMRWLGLTYDEGPDIGGPYPPYRQSQRHDRHAEVVAMLVERGYAYESFSTPEESAARLAAAGKDVQLGYDNGDRDLTPEQRAAFRAEGREAVIRFRMPDEDITFHDLIRGEVTFRAGTVPDYVIVRGNGIPLYTLVNPVDDADQKITHVFRGEDLLSSTPRQVALWRAMVELGIADDVPTYAHLPLVVGNDNRKLSKRDPSSNLFHHRDRGFVRDGMVNYLALLGWSISADRDVFTPEEMVAAFDIVDVSANPAHWDQKKAEAINAEHIRRMTPEAFTSELREYLQTHGVLPMKADMPTMARLREVAELIQVRVQVLAEAVPLVQPFFVPDDQVVPAQDALAGLPESTREVLDAAVAALDAVEDRNTFDFDRPQTFDATAVEEALKAALVEEMGLKPRVAYAPLRVALSGQRVSPPLFESMAILGKQSTLARLRALRDAWGTPDLSAGQGGR